MYTHTHAWCTRTDQPGRTADFFKTNFQTFASERRSCAFEMVLQMIFSFFFKNNYQHITSFHYPTFSIDLLSWALHLFFLSFHFTVTFSPELCGVFITTAVDAAAAAAAAVCCNEGRGLCICSMQPYNHWKCLIFLKECSRGNERSRDWGAGPTTQFIMINSNAFLFLKKTCTSSSCRRRLHVARSSFITVKK